MGEILHGNQQKNFSKLPYQASDRSIWIKLGILYCLPFDIYGTGGGVGGGTAISVVQISQITIPIGTPMAIPAIRCLGLMPNRPTGFLLYDSWSFS